jgi:hypothetical protein
METVMTKQEMTRAEALNRARVEKLVIRSSSESASQRTASVELLEDPTGGYVVRWLKRRTF